MRQSLSEPIDEWDKWMDAVLGDPVEKRLQENSKDEWLPTHDYCEVDSELDDEDTLQQAMNTLEFYIVDERNNPRKPDFEYQFRAFLHNNDYSYSPATIKHLISSVLGLD